VSLNLILPPDGVQVLLSTWPDEPRAYQRTPGDLEQVISARTLHDHMETGCIPAGEIAVIKAPHPSLSQKSHQSADGRTDAARLRKLHGQGHTIIIGNLQRVIPAMARASRAIQQETGYGNYVHAFLTPPGSQGLRHHWDQQAGIIAQLEGTKRWHLWRPPVEAPMRAYNESWRVWKDTYVQEWEAAGPDIAIDLQPGQSLVIPRGWVHNPHVTATDHPSVHLTFALRERTPIWLAEQLTAAAIHDPRFRRILPPAEVTGPDLTAQIRETRDALINHLTNLDPESITRSVREAALTEPEHGP
jgi:ribosomal protein L16 Arg81 hydroxylase